MQDEKDASMNIYNVDGGVRAEFNLPPQTWKPSVGCPEDVLEPMQRGRF